MNAGSRLTAYVVRHGQTEANRDGIIQGQADSPLTPEGVESSLRKAEKLARLDITVAYSSDLPRAVTTLKLILDKLPHSLDAVYSPLLREIDFGELTGNLKDEALPMVTRHKADTSLPYPGGESGDDLRQRVMKFFNNVYQDHGGQSILVVTHYGVMETLARHVAGVPENDPLPLGEDDIWRVDFYSPSAAMLDAL